MSFCDLHWFSNVLGKAVNTWVLLPDTDVKGPYPDSAVGEGCDAGTMNGTYGSCDELCKTVAKCGNGNKKTREIF